METIWQIYSDIMSWTTWDEGIEHASLDGPFVTGTRGLLQPKGQDKLSFQLTEVEPWGGFSDVCRYPKCRNSGSFCPSVAETQGGTSITHSVSITGPNAESFGPEFIAKLSQGIPHTMKRLAALAVERENELER